MQSNSLVRGWFKAEIEVQDENAPSTGGEQGLEVGNTTSLRQSLLRSHRQLSTLKSYFTKTASLTQRAVLRLSCVRPSDEAR